MTSRILVATDFSECSKAAVEAAADLAKKLDATIVLMTSWETPTAPYPGVEPESPDELQLRAKAALDFAAGELRTRGLEVQAALRCGIPWEQILNASKELHADLIVMGTHGRRGFKRFLIGSTAERVVRASEIPSMVVPTRSRT